MACGQCLWESGTRRASPRHDHRGLAHFSPGPCLTTHRKPLILTPALSVMPLLWIMTGSVLVVQWETVRSMHTTTRKMSHPSMDKKPFTAWIHTRKECAMCRISVRLPTADPSTAGVG